MPGVFSRVSRPQRAGAYFNWIGQVAAAVRPSLGSIVAIPFTSDWGPFKTVVSLGSFQEYLSIYGPTLGTPGYKAAWQAFSGERGYEGRFGAGEVLAYRTGGSSAAQAQHQFQNTTPVNSLLVKGKYAGTYGNKIQVTVQDHAADNTKDELLVYVDGVLAETYVYTDTDIVSLATEINTVSDWIVATEEATGVKLGYVSSVALTGGDDGSTLTGTEWTDIQNVLGAERFGIFVPYGLTDSTILASILAWAGGVESGHTGLNTQGRRFAVVVGGAAAETNASALSRSASLNDGNFINLGQSTLQDENLLDANGNPVQLSTAEFAASFAGGLAQRGEAMSTTFMRFPGVSIVSGTAPTDAEILKGLQGGVVLFSKDSDPLSPVKVEKGLTTYTNQTQDNFPYVIYRNPKFMRTMQNVEVEFTDYAASTFVGKLPVNNKTRDQAMSWVKDRLATRASVGIIQSGYSVAVDDNPPPSDDDEFVALRVGIKFGRSVEQVFFSVYAG